MTIKELFDKAENGTLTYEQFMTAAGTAKFVDLTEGQYVSKQKYTDELGQKDKQIQTLSETITARDTDLAALQTTLKDAGDIEALKKASADLAELQKTYAKDTKQYQAQLKQQAYEFAVRDFANGKQFSSKAARRDFEQAMKAKKLPYEDGRIIGAEDFVTMYTAENADAFVVEKPAPPAPVPTFVQPTNNPNNDRPTLSQLMAMANNGQQVNI